MLPRGFMRRWPDKPDAVTTKEVRERSGAERAVKFMPSAVAGDAWQAKPKDDEPPAEPVHEA